MSRLEWDKTTERTYETGVDMVVLYPQADNGAYPEGFAWNGITNVSDKPTGAETTALFANNGKYLNLVSAEALEGGIQAYTYPDQWGECDGSAAIAEGIEGVTIGQQNRRSFGLCYRTIIGNDVLLNGYGYKLHLVYGATASPTEKAYNTVNDSPEAGQFSWDFKTTPVDIPGKKPSASVEIDSTKVTKAQLKAIEDILYGTETEKARLPLPAEIIQIFTTQG